MFLKYIILTVLAIIFPSSTIANKFNISLSDLTTCEVYNIKTRGYTYADFFQVDSMKNNKINGTERLHLKFYVMTSMDAHILLSEVDKPRKSNRVYEIVLGAGSNSFSAIRTKMSSGRVATTLVGDLLSVFDPMPVEIIQYKDGLLVVNIANVSEPHLNFTDASPLNIRYVSFSSYGSTPAKWYYDCKFDGFFGEMEMESRPLANEERLTADILNVSEPDQPPPNVTQIMFSFKVRSVEFDQRASVMSTRLHLNMEWIDTRLKWNASEYGDVKYIVQPLFKIWHPVLRVEDGALDTFKKFKPFYSIRVDCDGRVRMFARNAELHSWCFDVNENWPNDVTKCEIILDTSNDYVKLAYNSSTPLTDQSINELSEWSINEIKVMYSTYERNGSDQQTNNTKKAYLQAIADDLKIQLTISRNSDFYHCVFAAPVYVSEALILLAFFLEEYRRGGLNLVAIVVVSIGFMFVAKHAPPTILSDIVYSYEVLLQVATATYILHVVSIWLDLYPPKVQPHLYVMNVINSSTLRFILAMRFEDSTAYVAAQEYPWQEISKMLNRLTFIGILITFVCINCTI